MVKPRIARTLRAFRFAVDFVELWLGEASAGSALDEWVSFSTTPPNSEAPAISDSTFCLGGESVFVIVNPVTVLTANFSMANCLPSCSAGIATSLSVLSGTTISVLMCCSATVVSMGRKIQSYSCCEVTK